MSALTAFVLIDPVTKLVMEAIDPKKKEVTVRIEHKNQPKAAEQPKHLKLYERADGSRYFNWRFDNGHSQRFNARDFVVSW